VTGPAISKSCSKRKKGRGGKRGKNPKKKGWGAFHLPLTGGKRGKRPQKKKRGGGVSFYPFHRLDKEGVHDSLGKKKKTSIIKIIYLTSPWKKKRKKKKGKGEGDTPTCTFPEGKGGQKIHHSVRPVERGKKRGFRAGGERRRGEVPSYHFLTLPRLTRKRKGRAVGRET